MIKFIMILLVICGGYWAYMNVDFAQILPNSVDKVQNEKTIFKVNSSRDQNKQDVDNALKGL